jgi:hypothetical protein
MSAEATVLAETQTTSPPRSASASVRIDADTRTKLTELQKRLLTQSSRKSDLDIRQGGIPLGLVVEMGLRALERELNAAIALENDGLEVTA